MDTSSRFRVGASLLDEALSPTSRHLVRDYFASADAHAISSDNNALEVEESDSEADDELDENLRASTAAFHVRNSLATDATGSSDYSPTQRKDAQQAVGARTDHALRKMVSTAVFSPASNGNATIGNRSFAQIECAQRPFCLQLSTNSRGEIVVAGFTSDPNNGGARGTVERSGLIQVGDVLVAVNDEMDSLTGSVDAAPQIMLQAQLPALLTFRRLPVVKNTLGEYSREQIARNLDLHDNKLSRFHGVQDAASIIKACVDVQDDHKSMTPLMHYVQRIENFLYPTTPQYQGDAQRRLEELRIWMDRIHQYADKQTKDQYKKWNANKAANYKRIEMISKQRDSIHKRLEKMQAEPDLLHPENQTTWKEFIELRHLGAQLTHSVEQAKRDHYLPGFEGYVLRFGSDGVYVGLGDLWLASFHAMFTIETRTRAPHVVFHLSTPSMTGLKLRCTNVKLSTEGRLPSLQCDELNIEAQLVADVPFVFDEVSGWSVPQDDLRVKLQSFSYYERRNNSTKRGFDHDTVIKLFINRLLPSVVKHAAQSLFCVELGPLFESRDAQLALSGEIKIDGRPLSLYDAPFNTPKTGGGTNATPAEAELSDEVRRLMVLSEEEADALCRIFKSVETSSKKRGFVTSEHSNLSLRVMSHYFIQFKQFPHVQVLLAELWNQSLHLLLTGSASSAEPTESFATNMIANIEQLQQYPVDVSLTLSEVTFRLDLCEGAATYYTLMQRLLRHRINSVSVGLSNLDALKDGSYFESKLTALDDWYEKVTRVLSYVTTNVDDLGVVIRGGIPAGSRSNVALEAHNLTCKGPCTGSFTIPLTDLATLRLPDKSQATDTFSALLHERNSLVFAKFFLSLNEDDGGDDGTSSNQATSDGLVHELPQDRISVVVKNTSAKVLFELPSDLSTLTPGTTFEPFSIQLDAEDGEPPKLRFETGEFAKCQYKAEQIKISGSMWRLLKRSTDQVDSAVSGASANDTRSPKETKKTEEQQKTEGGTASEDESIWTDYLESPFFFFKFHCLTSCQVTRDHIYWSLKSASLSHPNVARVRHRISLVELLQDMGTSSLDDDSGGGNAQRLAKRRQDARFRRALFQKLGNNNPDDDAQTIGRASLNFSTLSVHDTPHSRSSAAGVPDDDGFERWSDDEFQLVKGDQNADVNDSVHSNDDNNSASPRQETEVEQEEETSNEELAPLPVIPIRESVVKQSSMFF